MGRYLAWAAAAAIASFAIVWAYVISFPMGFAYTDYAVWLAKDRMLAACDVGELAVFGDSLPEAGFIPRRLPVTAENLAFNAGTPIETYYEVKRMLACPHPARRVVVSLTPISFAFVTKYLWANSFRYGILGWSELDEITATARRLGDPSFANARTDDGLSGPARDVLNIIHFPPLYFGSLWQGQIFLRYRDNVAMLQKALAARGYVPFGDRGFGVGAPSDTDRAPAPLNDDFFNRTLALLSERGIAVDFVVMPASNKHFHQMSADSVARFAAYLRGYEARYGGFHVIGELSPWPDELFADGSHLNLRGAEIFTDRFGHCLARALAEPKTEHARMQCDFDWAVMARGE